MVYMIYGAVGALVVLGLLSVGFLLGWKGHGVWRERTRRAADQEAGQRERREAVERQRAFEGMLNYNMDVAYGMDTSLGDLVEGER